MTNINRLLEPTIPWGIGAGTELDLRDIVEFPVATRSNRFVIDTGVVTSFGGRSVNLASLFVEGSSGLGELFVSGWVSTETVAKMQTDIEDLEGRIAELEMQVESLLNAAGRAIVIRTVERDQAKREIRDLFESGETLYYSDIVRRLGLDISLVVELCKELELEGQVMTLGNLP